MKQHQAGPATNRRSFLKGMAAAGGATALTSVFASRLHAADAGGTATRKYTDKASRGYHETDHIKDYYRTLRT
ncbi:MAG: twin-arginine translocation signal domain-containing protein [Gammaproteobacteria bacterium]|nr:MAG: twin-arginine translocation signal domain-containing protein [Gammaproteobacteria bacterium]